MSHSLRPSLSCVVALALLGGSSACGTDADQSAGPRDGERDAAAEPEGPSGDDSDLELEPETPDGEPESAPEPDVQPEPSGAPEPSGGPEPTGEPEPGGAPEPTAEPEPSAGPEPEPSAEPEPTGEPEPSGAPEPAGEPVPEPESSGAEPRGPEGSPWRPEIADCDPLPAPEGDIVELSPGDDLAQAVDAAGEGTTLLLADGTYDVSAEDYIIFDVPGVTLRSRSGNAQDVVIDGGYAVGSILNVRANDITIADVTLQHCQWHPIHVTGGVDSDIQGTFIYRVNVTDPGQQAIKINSSDGHYADAGTIACSNLLLTDAGREYVTDCYTGGIDAHLARGWWVYKNHIEGFFCQQGLSEHAVHFWNAARDTLVERNQIVDCARGVGFGLGESGNGTSRDYGDDACSAASYVGHYDGTIRNNMIFGGSSALFSSEYGFDSGVSLEQACGTVVVHNTVFTTEEPFVSMEYRFGDTDVVIADNLTSHRIMERDGATAELLDNLTEATADHFVDAAAGNLHLASGSAAIDSGQGVPSAPVETDIDGELRDDLPDVGADEF